MSMKYNYFKVHRWEILKAIKEKELKQKIKRNKKRKFARDWIIMRALQYHITRSWQIYSREKFMKELFRKQFFVILRITIKMRLSLKNNGRDFDTRLKRRIKHALTAMGGSTLRVNCRERAKNKLHQYLSQRFE